MHKSAINLLQGVALTENFVATELVKHGKKLNYYDKKSRQELDFIFNDGGKIGIIEVKSGNDYQKHASLSAALNEYSQRISRAIVLSKFNVKASNDIRYYPLYMTMFL